MGSDLPANKFATIKDIAELAGTTAATVSYVLNGTGNRYISDKLRERVKEAASSLNYIKSSAASSLKGKKTNVIAVLSPQYENHFFASIFAAIERTAAEQGYVLTTLNTFDDPQRELKALDNMLRLRVDGFVIIPTIGGGNNTESIRSHNVPCVVVERPLVGIADGKYDFISSDNLGASYTLTRHSLEHGHKRIALAYWESEIVSNIFNLRDRRQGYVNAMQEQGLYDPRLVFEGDITRAEGERITEAIIKDKSITSIVYAHYILAEGGIQYLRKNRLRVPDDISISILGAPAWMDMVETDFTHIIQPGERLGREAVEILCARINGDDGKKVVITIQPTLHIGKSVNKI